MASRADNWRFSWARTWNEVWAPSFLERWERLRVATQRGHVFHTPALVRAWAETCGAAIAAEPLVGHVTGPGGSEMLLPWVVVTYAGRVVRRRVLEPAGRAFFGYHDPIVVGEVDWPSFWEAARETVGDACDAALFRLLPASFARGPLAEDTVEDSPILEIGAARTLDDVLAGCSPNHRGDLRRRFRRLADAGRVELWMPPAADASVLADVRERFIPMLSANLAARLGVAEAEQGLAGFIERLVTDGLAGGWGSYAVLRVDGEPIAWHLGYRDAESFYWAFPTHVPAWDDHSPGKVLLARLIESALERGLRRVHLLTGAQPYKLAWKPTRPRLGVIRWYAPSVRGHLLAQYDRVHGAGALAAGIALMAHQADITSGNLANYDSEWSRQEYGTEVGLRPIEADLVDEFFPRPPARVLDVGCGAGRTTTGLVDRGYDVLGIDLAEPLLAVARQRYPHVPFERMDATALGLRDRSFDAALFSYNGIDNIYPREGRLACLREVRRVLRDRGVFALSSHNLVGAIFSGGFLYVRGYLNALGMLAAQITNPLAREWYVRDRDGGGRQHLYSAPPAHTIADAETCGFEVLAVRGATGERRLRSITLHQQHVHFVLRKR